MGAAEGVHRPSETSSAGSMAHLATRVEEYVLSRKLYVPIVRMALTRPYFVDLPQLVLPVADLVIEVHLVVEVYGYGAEALGPKGARHASHVHQPEVGVGVVPEERAEGRLIAGLGLSFDVVHGNEAKNCLKQL